MTDSLSRTSKLATINVVSNFTVGGILGLVLVRYGVPLSFTVLTNVGRSVSITLRSLFFPSNNGTTLLKGNSHQHEEEEDTCRRMPSLSPDQLAPYLSSSQQQWTQRIQIAALQSLVAQSTYSATTAVVAENTFSTLLGFALWTRKEGKDKHDHHHHQHHHHHQDTLLYMYQLALEIIANYASKEIHHAHIVSSGVLRACLEDIAALQPEAATTISPTPTAHSILIDVAIATAALRCILNMSNSDSGVATLMSVFSFSQSSSTEHASFPSALVSLASSSTNPLQLQCLRLLRNLLSVKTFAGSSTANQAYSNPATTFAPLLMRSPFSFCCSIFMDEGESSYTDTHIDSTNISATSGLNISSTQQHHQNKQLVRNDIINRLRSRVEAGDEVSAVQLAIISQIDEYLSQQLHHHHHQQQQHMQRRRKTTSTDSTGNRNVADFAVEFANENEQGVDWDAFCYLSGDDDSMRMDGKEATRVMRTTSVLTTGRDGGGDDASKNKSNNNNTPPSKKQQPTNGALLYEGGVAIVIPTTPSRRLIVANLLKAGKQTPKRK